jgi:site-specific DNA-cytosine methylase
VIVVGDLQPDNKWQGKVTRQQNFVISSDGVSMAITAKHLMHEFKIQEPSYRIRKLTERECFRLMDVPEEYIDRIQAAGISRSQQYKMAGNSIVVACMYHLFRKLWIDTQIKTLTLF